MQRTELDQPLSDCVSNSHMTPKRLCGVYTHRRCEMDVQIAARYRGCLHGRLPVDCTHFKGDVLVAVGGYSHAGSVHVFEPLEGLKV